MLQLIKVDKYFSHLHNCKTCRNHGNSKKTSEIYEANNRYFPPETTDAYQVTSEL